MNTELHNLLDKAIQDWIQLSFLKIINVNNLKEGDIIVFRSDEPIDREILGGIRAHLMTQRPDLTKLGIMSIGIDEDIEVVHELTPKEC
jgi:hypothetical protein